MKVLFWMFIGFDQHATSEHLLSAVIERLCEAGHSVHIIQKNTGGNLPAIPERLSNYDVTTTVIPYQAADKGNFIARYLTELKYINACKKHITSGYDAVFIQSTNVAGFAVKAVRGKLPKAIVTFNVQDIFPYNLSYSGGLKKNSPVFKIMAVEQRYGYKHSDHIITISEDMKDTLVADGVDDKKVEVIYNWSYQDEPYENIDLAPVSHLFDKNYFNVVYAGNIGVMQNVDILVEAARLMMDDKDVWFHIIGNGVYKDKLEARVKEYGITNISFWPMQSPEFAPSIYSAADVNVIPLAADILITDYSAIAFDYSILCRPIFCYAYDYDTYLAERGTYFQIDDKYPNKSCRTEEELLARIKGIDYKAECANTKRFRDEFIQYGIGATEACVKAEFGRS